MCDEVDCAGAELEHQQGEGEPADHSACADGEQEGDNAHFKDAGGKDEHLPGGRGRQHGGNHDGEEFLTLEAEADAVEARTVNAFEEEELSAGAPESIGQESADGGADGAQEAIEPEVRLVVPDVDGEDGIHGYGDGGGIEKRDDADTPEA